MVLIKITFIQLNFLTQNTHTHTHSSSEVLEHAAAGENWNSAL